MSEKLHIVQQDYKLKRADRNQKMGHRSFSLWFTGLSGSGKSTLANLVEQELHNQGFAVYVLDGDNIRSGLNKDLDFTEAGRIENIRRISEVAKLMNDAGVIVLTAFISPFVSDRASARELIGDESFVEVHVDCPLEVCEQRDVKGLYQKARNGEIKNFTGIDSPFEEPESPELKVSTHTQSLEESASQVLEYIIPRIKLS